MAEELAPRVAAGWGDEIDASLRARTGCASALDPHAGNPLDEVALCGEEQDDDW